MAYNPEVTVRCRGVMEKCTYCVQRINGGQDRGQERAQRPIQDGEITHRLRADLPDRGHRLRRPERLRQPGQQARKNTRRAYALLAELNIKPRTAYLARMRNCGTRPGATALPGARP